MSQEQDFRRIVRNLKEMRDELATMQGDDVGLLLRALDKGLSHVTVQPEEEGDEDSPVRVGEDE